MKAHNTEEAHLPQLVLKHVESLEDVPQTALLFRLRLEVIIYTVHPPGISALCTASIATQFLAPFYPPPTRREHNLNV